MDDIRTCFSADVSCHAASALTKREDLALQAFVVVEGVGGHEPGVPGDFCLGQEAVFDVADGLLLSHVVRTHEQVTFLIDQESVVEVALAEVVCRAFVERVGGESVG